MVILQHGNFSLLVTRKKNGVQYDVVDRIWKDAKSRDSGVP